MHYMKNAAVCCILGLCLICCAGKTASSGSAESLFFDDFSYSGPGDAALPSFGWAVRTEPGSPGFSAGTFSASRISFPSDESDPSNTLLRLSAVTSGTPASCDQAEIRQARKFLEGTYAARVRFYDDAAEGNDGDAVISTFFVINDTLSYAEAGYSECDFEYLPNGGWGSGPSSAMYFTSWGTQPASGGADIDQTVLAQSMEGWHILVLVVADGAVRYYIDGTLRASHGGDHYPETLMSINFNLWFSTVSGELIASDASPRVYRQDVDWVFHAKGAVLATDEVVSRVAALRTAAVERRDELE